MALSGVMRLSRAARIAVFICLLIPSGYIAWTFRAMPHMSATGGDDQIYLVSAKSLATGAGYRILSLPGEPYQAKFPILYPLILSFVWRLAPGFPQNLPALMLFSWLALPAYLLLAKRIFASWGFTETESLLMCAVMALSLGVLLTSTTLGPDLMFSALLLMVFLVLREKEGQSVAYVVLAGVLAGLAYLLRSAAIPTLATAPLCFVSRRRFLRAALFILSMAPFVLGWSLWSRSHLPSARDVTTVFYTNYFGDFLLNFSWGSFPVVVVRNLGWALEYIGLLIVFMPWRAVLWVCGGLAVVGAARMARRSGSTQYHLFAIGYSAMLLVWVGKPLPRYLIPLQPLMLGGFVYIILEVSGAARSALRRTSALATLAVVCLGGELLGFQVYVNGLDSCARQAFDERQAFIWIESNLPKRAKFVADRESVLYLYTNRQATSYQFLKRNIYTESAEEWDQWREALPSFARERGLEYAFCDARSCPGALTAAEMPKARAVLDRNYHEIFRAGAVTVYKLRE